MERHLFIYFIYICIYMNIYYTKRNGYNDKYIKLYTKNRWSMMEKELV